ncbi:MAG: dTDP-4-dehydrorhamnose reductase [Planctomycetota bacterium]
MKKTVIIGAGGLLGSQLVAAFRTRGDAALYPLSRRDIDITDRRQVRSVLEEIRPAVIVNAAAVTDVDACEANAEQAFEVNAFGASNLAMVADRLDATLVHISTDYVFGGTDPSREHGFREDEPIGPVNEYGRSKADGEKFVKSLCGRFYICRTAWLFGPVPAASGRTNYPLETARCLRTDGRLRAVTDHKSSPSYTPHVARAIAGLVDRLPGGTYHVANHGQASWYEYAAAVRDILGLAGEVTAAAGADVFRTARRPRFAALDNCNLRMNGMDDLPTWREALEEYLTRHTV